MSAPVRVVVLTAEELRELIREAVADARVDAPAAPALLDRRGLAIALDVSPDTVDRLRREGSPEMRVGDAPRFDLADVLAWLKARPR